MTITKQEADTVYALARALEDTGRLCSLAESDDKLEWRRKNQETQCALQDVLKQLQEPESEPTAIEALTLALETERDAALKALRHQIAMLEVRVIRMEQKQEVKP